MSSKEQFISLYVEQTEEVIKEEFKQLLLNWLVEKAKERMRAEYGRSDIGAWAYIEADDIEIHTYNPFYENGNGDFNDWKFSPHNFFTDSEYVKGAAQLTRITLVKQALDATNIAKFYEDSEDEENESKEEKE